MTNPAFSETRNTAARAISTGCAMRPSGIARHLDDFLLAATIPGLGCVREPGRDRIDPDAVRGEL